MLSIAGLRLFLPQISPQIANELLKPDRTVVDGVYLFVTIPWSPLGLLSFMCVFLVLLIRSECSRAGSLETLDVQPKANGKNTRNELIKFYEANYSANLMRLVVYGKGASKFSPIPQVRILSSFEQLLCCVLHSFCLHVAFFRKFQTNCVLSVPCALVSYFVQRVWYFALFFWPDSFSSFESSEAP